MKEKKRKNSVKRISMIKDAPERNEASVCKKESIHHTSGFYSEIIRKNKKNHLVLDEFYC